MHYPRHLIAHIAHEFPPTLSYFGGLGSAPHNLYLIVSFDKLHVLDLGIFRQFCDLTNTVLHLLSSLPLSRVMGIANLRYSTLPFSARLSSHHPFRCNQHDSQADITGKIRRESVPFLWVCEMGPSNLPPDDDSMVQFALQLDVVNHVICQNFD